LAIVLRGFSVKDINTGIKATFYGQKYSGRLNYSGQLSEEVLENEVFQVNVIIEPTFGIGNFMLTEITGGKKSDMVILVILKIQGG